MKLFGNNSKIQSLYLSQCDVMKFKAVAILMHGGCSNHVKTR